MNDFSILAMDKWLIVLVKPAGLLSVPGRGPEKQDCLSRRVQSKYPEALVVHRLDMATSGLILMARNAEIQKNLSRAFAERQVLKRYSAVVEGKLQPATREWNSIELPIAADWPRRPLRVIDPQLGKPSLTRWRLQPDWPHEAGQTSSRLELEPVTGRSHQLRVHLQSIGHPIVGDALYGNFEADSNTSRLMLHASEISLQHPATGDRMHWHSPADF